MLFHQKYRAFFLQSAKQQGSVILRNTPGHGILQLPLNAVFLLVAGTASKGSMQVGSILVRKGDVCSSTMCQPGELE